MRCAIVCKCLPAALGVIAVSLAFVHRASTQPSADSGAELFRLCAQCHGPAGHGNRAIGAPGLTALEPWYFARQLRSFRTGARGQADADPHQPVMETIAHGLGDDATISSLIDYVGQLPEYVPPITLVGDTERGRQLFEACDSCHGLAGQGNETVGAPGLAYRDDWYLQTQLEQFVSGERGSHPADMFGQQMVPVSRVVTDAQAVLDLVAYINTLD